MITVKKINKIGLLNHVSGYRGQVELKNSELLDDMKHIYLEANIGDVILLHKHSIHCSLPNRSDKDFLIKPGDRIAQMVIVPIERVKFEIVDKFKESKRGEKGFGSSGVD